MAQATRSNLMPAVLVLLALLPAALGMAPGLVRCEHADATAHFAQANHHEQPAAEADCCCGAEHGDATPQLPTDPSEAPCDDTPIEIEPVPTHGPTVSLQLPDAPLLPVTVWNATEQFAPTFGVFEGGRDAHPPGGDVAPEVVQTTIFRL